MTRKKILLISLLITAAIFLISYLPNRRASVDSVLPTPPPTPQATRADAPDSQKTLYLKTKKSGKMTTYTLSVVNKSDGGEKQIFAKTFDSSGSISIPFNTWSPDDKYVLIKKDSSFFVLSSLVSSDSQDDQTTNVTDLFMKKYPNYKVTDVTGWASPTLVIITTNKEDGSRGPSFWFEVPSHAIIQLSTRL